RFNKLHSVCPWPARCKFNLVMEILKFKADYLFTGSQMLEGGYVLVADQKGKILDIITQNEAGDAVKILKGILSPGFINCHCHLELSHLKNKIPPKTGLIDFVATVVSVRHFHPDEILK